MKKGILYIVATPIGNLEDITYLAVRVLKEADRIACEDTRVSAKLLSRYDISKPLLSWHHHSSERSIESIIDNILSGEDIAYVTDAGTPGISDPGNELVDKVLKQDIEVVPIPGPTALGALISISGLDMQKFCFLGFPPHKKGRQTFFKHVCESAAPVIYYESPHRVIKNLELLSSMDQDKKIVIGRELTKKFESTYRGNILEVLDMLQKAPTETKGEFVVIVHDIK